MKRRRFLIQRSTVPSPYRPRSDALTSPPIIVRIITVLLLPTARLLIMSIRNTIIQGHLMSQAECWVVCLQEGGC
ncbi:hypothetical protein IF1G_07925 [Cordyceps javanica]|uniref:Uncharacterized protein n=1 Tax=Cordyceps javanica TaxID=43265 RepID=A0A545UV57_9HYPO|nr:hypothetical protein IF1G_07925 [Cordyceps javanica]